MPSMPCCTQRRTRCPCRTGQSQARRTSGRLGSSLVSWKRPMPDPGLSRASEDAGSLAVPSTRAIGPYVGGAACRFVASRWPWRLRLLAGPGSRIPSCCPSVQPERAWGASRSAGDTRLHGPPSTSALSCTHASQWNFDRQRPSAGRPTRTRERAGAPGHARRCALKCAMCALHAAFYMLQAACCILHVAYCDLRIAWPHVACCIIHGCMVHAEGVRPTDIRRDRTRGAPLPRYHSTAPA